MPLTARLSNDLRQAEREWQQHSAFNAWPGGNPWAAHRDEAAARYDRIRAEIDAPAIADVPAHVDAIHAAAGMGEK